MQKYIIMVQKWVNCRHCYAHENTFLHLSEKFWARDLCLLEQWLSGAQRWQQLGEPPEAVSTRTQFWEPPGCWPFIPVWCVARTCINFGITCSGPFLANTFTRCPHGRGRLSKQGSLSQISCHQTRVLKILISSVLRNTSLKRERKRERTKQAYLLNHERNKSTNADKFLLISL